MKETRRFVKNDGGFICINCGEEIAPLGYTSRNHCPRCLFSVHLDIMPGDRQNACGGILEPVLSEPNTKNGYAVIFRCRKCGGKTRNKSAADDNADLLIALTNPENYLKYNRKNPIE